MADANSASSIALPLITAAAGLAGVLLGLYWTGRRERDKRRIEFATRQLSEFYGPLLSLRQEILARSNLRVKIDAAIDQGYMENLLEAGRDGIDQVQDEHIPPLLAVIEDDNKTFADILMPLYRRMLETFRDKMWLAEPETRAYFSELVEFIEVWERVLRDALPRHIPGEIGHTEQNLHPFYRHVEETHDRLRGVVAS